MLRLERMFAGSLSRGSLLGSVIGVPVVPDGGIGFTGECDVQVWFKRVMFDRLWLGAPELHRERFAALEGW